MSKLILVMLTLLCLTLSQSAFAQPGKSVAHHSHKSLPSKHYRVSHSGKSYFYAGGMFYQQRKGSYLTITAPFGAIVPTLSKGFVTFGLGSNRYYYLSGIYYQRAPQGYVVIRKPQHAESVLASAGSNKLIIYPARGQDEDQRRRDRFECFEWASNETGFNPADVDADNLLQADYRRAMSACLEARHYVVK
ncbi:MAG: hypothetical protein ACI8Z1_000312 [Candidatus Azotimanducaceae bacterium]|jgi:hypothetical protein